ncbi:hypothetical protein K7X08_010808 [Anisodus acutangulus]|uniref:Pentatricopeptide repeat-containing protein n=1 Tax=Anisodus acutangulus TaxID=402998 RepID=A0A9Q1M2G2_9SOLA|nr:hypothetical protein K7X08_010808 [Anisodus acutangulus]
MTNKDVSWNTVIGGNVQSGFYEEALDMLREMSNANLKPDCFTLSSVLPVFARHVDVSKGKEIQEYFVQPEKEKLQKTVKSVDAKSNVIVIFVTWKLSLWI